MYETLKSAAYNVRELELTTYDLGKADWLMTIHRQIEFVTASMKKVVDKPDYYSIENILNQDSK